MEFDSKKERKHERKKKKKKKKKEKKGGGGGGIKKKGKEGKTKCVITKCGVYGWELPVKGRLWCVQRQENVQYQVTSRRTTLRFFRTQAPFHA